MRRTQSRLFIGVQDQVSARGHLEVDTLVGGDHPVFSGWITIGQIIAGKIDGGIAGIVYFDPIRELTLVVRTAGLIVGHDFVDVQIPPAGVGERAGGSACQEIGQGH